MIMEDDSRAVIYAPRVINYATREHLLYRGHSIIYDHHILIVKASVPSLVVVTCLTGEACACIICLLL
jgi:hypothetical protein